MEIALQSIHPVVSAFEKLLLILYSFILGCMTTQMCGTESNVLGCINKGNNEYVCVSENGDSYEFVENNPCGTRNMYFTKNSLVLARLKKCCLTIRLIIFSF